MLKEEKRPRGRPVFGRESYTEYVPLRLTPTQREYLRACAKRMRVGEAELIRRALDAYLIGAREAGSKTRPSGVTTKVKAAGKHSP